MSRAERWTDADLSDYVESNEGDERPNWEPQQSRQPDTGSRVQCACGNSVTRQFARVFGDNSDEVAMCNECATYRELRLGAVDRGGR